MASIVKTLPVKAKGVGRKDYSETTEFSVQSVIRSYQQVYNYWETVTVGAGATVVKDIPITSKYVALVYDFYASMPQSHLFRMTITAISGPITGVVATKNGYGSIYIQLSKGFAFFQTIRFTLQNFGAFSSDITIGAIGIFTDERNYNLQL